MPHRRPRKARRVAQELPQKVAAEPIPLTPRPIRADVKVFFSLEDEAGVSYEIKDVTVPISQAKMDTVKVSEIAQAIMEKAKNGTGNGDGG